MKHILYALLLLGSYLVNAKEQPLLHWDVFTAHSVILEQVSNKLDQSFLDLELDVTRIA